MRTAFLRPASLALAAVSLTTLSLSALPGFAATPAAPADTPKSTLTGKAAFTDYTKESPGTRRHVTVDDLPAPAPSESVDNGAHIVPRPDNVWPIAPKGFKVELYTTGLENPRLVRTAPNGDIFLAESNIDKMAGGNNGKIKQ